jgi:hypothetical protein
MIASASPGPGAQQPDRLHNIVVLRVGLFAAQAASAAPGKIERGNCVVQSPQAAGPVIIEGGAGGFAYRLSSSDSRNPRLKHGSSAHLAEQCSARGDPTAANLFC